MSCQSAPVQIYAFLSCCIFGLFCSGVKCPLGFKGKHFCCVLNLGKDTGAP
ncbi:unnamed protein product [Staurois parvus]|uniref:Uncharacterized protein n=1 Tax=Staurois parvus TaxID=386267 RepID=A0ABN9B3N5_9NEOB|nr:unnamed protein product [Staurois parvus]